jgi:hypothetical protein
MRIWFLIGVMSALSATAKDAPVYAVSAIPENMKAGMYAVIRESELRFEINSKKNATTYGRIVITILNPNALGYAKKVLYYDKFRVVKYFKGVSYDMEGNVLKKLKSSDIYDQSQYDGSLFSDNRLKVADLSHGTYPYTVEFEYEIEQKALLHATGFQLYTDDEISIEKSRYTLVYPRDLKPRYKAFNITAPKTAVDGDKEMLDWNFMGIKPEKFEKYGPDSEHIIPSIAVAPSEFEYDKYSGKMDSWDSYARWIISLNTDRDILPEQAKKRVHQLTATSKTTEEKVRVLYEYLQSRTRYVGIQLGIGGFQPFEASVVDQTGYGDCKALSNYLISMLKEVGIPANYTLIKAGEYESDIDTLFPSSQFNHVIVAVPNKSDTLWLECTSQTNPFGYLGEFTGNRHALMITDNGGKIVKTPSYTAEDNTQSRTAAVFVELTGDAKAKITTTYRGLQYENGELNHIINRQYDEQKKWLQKNIKIPAFDVVQFTMINNKKLIPSAVVNTELNLPRFATVSGKRVFLNPNLLNKSGYIPEKLETRKSKIVLRVAFTDLDTIQYHLPEGIYPEFLPETIKITARFGEYEASYTLDQGQLLYIRRLKMNKGEFPPESYKEFTDFYKSINKADNTKIVFMSKT